MSECTRLVHFTLMITFSSAFKVCAALDLKFYEENILIHKMDHTTSLWYCCCSIKRNQPILLIPIWNARLYGSVEEFLTEKDSEFFNDKFIALWKILNIVFTPLVQNPLGLAVLLIEKNTIRNTIRNKIPSEILNKVLEENRCSGDMRLAWCVNINNSLQNLNGFSPILVGNWWKPIFTSCSNWQTFSTVANTDKQNSKITFQQHVKSKGSLNCKWKLYRALRYNVKTSTIIYSWLMVHSITRKPVTDDEEHQLKF